MLGIPHIDKLSSLGVSHPVIVGYTPTPDYFVLVDPLPGIPFEPYAQWGGILCHWFASSVRQFSCRSKIGNHWHQYLCHYYPEHVLVLDTPRQAPSRAYLDYRRHVRYAYRLAGIALPRYPGE